MRLPDCLVFGRFAALAFVVSLLLPRAAEAQAVSAPGGVSPSAPRTVPVAERGTYQILTYGIADLLLDVPDYPYPSTANPPMPVGGTGGMGAPGVAMGGMGGGMGMGMGGMGGGMGAGGGMAGGGGMALGAMPGGGNMRVATAASNPTRITVEEIVRTLVMVVAPETWNEQGQGGATVVPLGTSLVVRQTAAAHQEIEKLLGQLREESSRRKTVAIDARWLLLDSDELDRLAPPATSATSAGPSAIDRKVLAEYTRRPSSLRGLTNCHTGQLVYLVSGTRRNVVSSFIPVVGSADRPEERSRQFVSLEGGARVFLTGGGGAEDDGPRSVGMDRASSVGYQPIVERPNFGVLLEIRPTLVPRGETATVDVRSTVTVPGRQSTDSGEKSSRQTLTPTVDRLAIETQELATTLSVPLGQPVLVGGMTHLGPAATTPDAEAAKADPPPAKETPQLYLVLELR
jgi:hypothetical protein